MGGIYTRTTCTKHGGNNYPNRLGEKGVVGKCCICSTLLTVYDEIVQHEANADIWCMTKDCETEQAWLAYYENNPRSMTTEEKLKGWQEVWNS